MCEGEKWGRFACFLVMEPVTGSPDGLNSGGFSDPLMQEIAKKHKAEKRNKLAQESLAIGQFESPRKIVDSMAKIVSQSSMVSIFEKPKFRDLTQLIR